MTPPIPSHSPDMEEVVSAHHVTKVFRDFWGREKVRALDDVSFTAHRGDVTRHVPAPAAEVTDTVGAGDIFNAGFLYGFLNGWGLAEAVKFANACGAMSVSKPGRA